MIIYKRLDAGKMLNFSSYISQFVFFPEKDKKIFNELCTRKYINKNDTLINQGDIAKEAYFLQKGVMVMVYEKKGRQFIRDFVFENTPAVAFPSFFNSKPARYSIRSITKCTLEVLTKRSYIESCIKIPKMKSIALTSTNHGHMALEKRFESILTLTPEERYIDLLQNNPEMINKIPVGMIASYLGISKQSLSRIRRRLTNKKILVI